MLITADCIHLTVLMPKNDILVYDHLVVLDRSTPDHVHGVWACQRLH